MKPKSSLALSICCLAALSAAVEAQEVPRVPVDRIVAIVGDTPIPLSRLTEQMNAYRQQGGQLPTDPDSLEQLQRQFLDQVIDDELLVQAARRDTTVVVSDEDVREAVDETLRAIRDQFPSQLDLERELLSAGFKSLDDYRLWRSDQTRRQLLSSTLMQQLRAKGELRPIPPTESEVREAFERTKGQHPQRPATVSFRQIAVVAKPDSAALRAAFVRADSVARQLRDGADFGALARSYSDDPQSKENGGELGWFRRGQGYVREFEEAAFRLRPGAISNPVYSPFGFHIIQVQRAEPASVQARHILIAPTITDADRAAGRERADSVMALLRSGVAFDSLARIFHDATQDRVVEDVPRQGLPQAYRDTLALAQPGEIRGPVEVDRGNGRVTYTVIVFEGARPEGVATLDDLRDQIRSSLTEENAILRYLRALRGATYIEIRL